MMSDEDYEKWSVVQKLLHANGVDVTIGNRFNAAAAEAKEYLQGPSGKVVDFNRFLRCVAAILARRYCNDE